MDRHYEPCPECGKRKRKGAELCRRCKPSYARTPEHRQKMSQLKKGKPHDYPSASTRPEIAEKIRKAWTPEMREAARQRGLVKAADPDWRKKIGEAVSGAKNPHWEGGRSEIPYAPGWGRVNRREVRKRANHFCEMCGELKPLDTHHKDGSKSNHAMDNLQALCRKCHKKAHAALRQKRKRRPC